MRYRLRTLQIALALLPPVQGFACVAAPRSGDAAALIVWWGVAFFAALTWRPLAVKILGLTVAEWLVVAAILVTTASLLVSLPVAQRE